MLQSLRAWRSAGLFVLPWMPKHAPFVQFGGSQLPESVYNHQPRGHVRQFYPEILVYLLLLRFSNPIASTMKKLLLSAFVLGVLILAPTSCSKNESTEPTTKAPTISKIKPDNGPVGTLVTIEGSNFSETESQNTITFGEATAVPSVATTTMLTVNVPEGATSEAVKVTVSGKTVTGGTFTVTEGNVAETSITLNKNTLDLFTLDSETLIPSFTGTAMASDITWSSEDESVAIVDENGMVTAVGAGSTLINAYISEEVSTNCSVTVSPSVFVVGYELVDGTEVAKLWTNGIGEELDNATFANSVFVSNSTVYVAGQDNNNQAAIWENGIPTNLTTGIQYGEAESIFVVESDVYATGIGEGYSSMVWKNNELLYTLEDGSTSPRAYGIYVDGADVYVAGYNRPSQYNVAKIWKNNTVLYELSGENSNGDARSVVVSDANVYAVGNEQSGQEDYIAKIWINGVANNFTDGSNYADSRSLFVDGTDVYALVVESTDTGDTIKVFKNQNIHYQLTDGSNTADAQSMIIVNDDIYVAGHVLDGEDYIATVWKNNQVLYELNQGTVARTFSIYVK